MKKIFSLVAIFSIGYIVTAQVKVNTGIQDDISGSNVGIDLSTSFSTESGAAAYAGKGVVIPSVDLVNFQFDLTLADGTTFPTYFDGMIVYNNATGTTVTTGNRSSTATAVVPGFYYFSNPAGFTNQSVPPGVWKPIGGAAPISPVINITTTEKVTNTQINGAAIYTKKGKFTASGTSTAPTAYTPAATTTGMTGLYRITIFKAGTGTVYSNSVYSYDIANGNLITGSPLMSVVYPAGDYDYVIEYTK